MLDTGEIQLTSAVIDSADGLAYFGTSSVNRVVRLRTSSYGTGGRIDCMEVCPCGSVMPNEVTYLRARKQSNDLELYWDSASNSDEYGVDREVNAARGDALDRSFDPIRIGAVTGTTYTDAGAVGDGNGLVSYRIRGRNCNGEGP